MDGIQRLREKAQAQGALANTEQQKIIVEQAPATTTVVEGAPDDDHPNRADGSAGRLRPDLQPGRRLRNMALPELPPYYYQPPGYVAAASLMSFGVGMAVGSSLVGRLRLGLGTWWRRRRRQPLQQLQHAT